MIEAKQKDCASDGQKMSHNYSIDIIRMMLAFAVVLCHFWSPFNSPIAQIIDTLRGCAASTFFLLSFYLTAKSIVMRDSEKIRRRIVRLNRPFFFWGIVAWLINVAAHLAIGSKDEMIMSLLWQMFTGSGYGINAPLWYLFVLILLTKLYYCIFKWGMRTGVALTISLVVFSLIIQYTNVNTWLFSNLSYEVRYPIGRIIEMIPYASIGILMFLSAGFEKKRWFFSLIGCGGIVLYCAFPSFLHVDGFGYSGVMKIVCAVSILFLCICYPLQGMPISGRKAIRRVTEHTLGIYCMHFIAGTYLAKVGIASGSVLFCTLVYILCYLCSEVFSKIPCMKQFVD